MAGNALGTTFFLLLASVIQGLQDDMLVHYETMEAEVGQNITLSCIVENNPDFKTVSFEWNKKKNESTKLGVWALIHGVHQFWSNVTVQIYKNEKNMVMGSYLHLRDVKKWDSGMYICEIKQFPSGSIVCETELIIKELSELKGCYDHNEGSIQLQTVPLECITCRDEDEIECDVNGNLEVHNGEDVSIRCREFPNAQYRWTKGKETVSEQASLELWRVTRADAGVYTLTVYTGNKSLHKEFIITVLTTSLSTDLMTASPQGLTESVNSSQSTSQTTELPTLPEWTKSNHADRPNTSEVTTITAEEHTTSSINSTPISVTSSPDARPVTGHKLNSTRSSYASTGSRQQMTTGEMRNESKLHTLRPRDNFSTMPSESSTKKNSLKNPETSPTQRIGTTRVYMEEREGTTRSHVLLLLALIPMILLIVIIGFLYRRQIIKKRMDMPPPFKPPPPPVKYTAARQSDAPTQSFPTSRCNSIAGPKDAIVI